MSDKLPIKLVVATRMTSDEFKQKSMTAQTATMFGAVSPVEIEFYAENKRPLGDVYNEAIDKAKDQAPHIICFVHDDVMFMDYYWTRSVRQGLELFDVVCPVGNQVRRPKQASWCVVNESGKMDDRENLSGAIMNGNLPPPNLECYGDPLVEVKLMDGLFMAARSDTLINNDVRFDPQFPFHFYDMDFCRTIEKAGLKMGTIPLPLVHFGKGVMGEEWQECYQKYLQKWGE